MEPASLSVVARWGFEEWASVSQDVCTLVWWHIFAILQQLCHQRTSTDDNEQFGLEAAKTLQNNFYVDDLLKPVAQEDQAIQLVENVKAMCSSGGFKLTRFLSNKKRVLQSILEVDRRKGVKDKDLVDNLPSEQALAVLWNTEAGNFGIKVTLKQKPMTKRGLLLILSSVYDPLSLAAAFYFMEDC